MADTKSPEDRRLDEYRAADKAAQARKDQGVFDRYKAEQREAQQRKKENTAPTTKTEMGKFKKGGRVRGDGCAQRGKTRGRMV